jgi:hypothetical protein
MAKVVEIYPDKSGIVRNVQILVKPNQDGSSKYKPSQGYELKRHVSKLMLLVPAEEKENVEKDENVEVEKVILDDVVEVENVIVDDDVCDSMAQSVGSSFNSFDVKKQEKIQAAQEEEVAASRCSPRFGHTNA